MRDTASVLHHSQLMNANRMTFGTSNQPDLRPVRSEIEREFSELRERSPQILRLALNEAEAVAWETGIAHLVFPVLAGEKARALSVWQSRQRFVRNTTAVLTLAE